MDRIAVKTLRDLMQAKLNEIPGFKITMGNARFDSATVAFKVDVLEIGSSSAANAFDARAEADFQRWAEMFSLAPTDLGRKFASGGASYKIIGLAPKSHLFPVLAKREPDGKIFKFPAEAVKRGLTN